MILSNKTYRGIIAFINSQIDNVDEYACFEALISKFYWINDKTLGSIFVNFLSKRTTLNIKNVKDDISNALNLFYELLNNNTCNIFVVMGRIYHVSPVSMARLILEYKGYKRYKKHEKEEKQDFSTFEYIKDPTLIPEGLLAHHVYMANLSDFTYSPVSTIMKSLSGKEYEWYLQRYLRAQGISFKTEEDLRELNHKKTPDIVLHVPIGVNNQVVKWVESKALFANNYTHQQCKENQYWPYYKRYGPGLVIYWFGYIDSIKSEKNCFLVYDHFPTHIVRIKRQS